NYVAVLILLAVAGTLGGGGHLLHAYQMKRNARELLAQADQAEAEGQPAQAADYLTQYLGLAPADTDALARYGLLRERLARGPRGRVGALLVLEEALRRDGSRQDVRRRAARLATEIRRFSDARHHLDALGEAADQD